jgi:hypothetical protein
MVHEKDKNAMWMLNRLAGLSIFLFAASIAAQTVTTSGGTANVIPKFSGASTLVNSVISEANGTVGIGAQLNVQSTIQFGGSVNPSTPNQGGYLNWNALTGSVGESDFINNEGTGSGGFAFMNTSSSGSPRKTLMVLDGNGNLSLAGGVNDYYFPSIGSPGQWAKIGTFTANQAGECIRITAILHNGYNAANSQDSTYFITFTTANGVSVDGNGFAGNSSYYAIGFNGTIAPGNIKWVANAAGVNATSYDLYINLPIYPVGSHYIVSLGGNSSWTNAGVVVSGDPGPASSTILIPNAEFDLPYGNVGIGTNVPSAKLEVNGNVKLTAGSGASITFPDNTVQSTAWNGTLYGGDYAEAVTVSGDANTFEPGDVLVLCNKCASDVAKSSEPYSKLVSGIYSTKPGILGRRRPNENHNSEIPMAMVGTVPTKVTTEGGSIERGDLLVTSSTSGYAMKGTDQTRMLGVIIGKAMGNLSSGAGVIDALVSLQ